MGWSEPTVDEVEKAIVELLEQESVGALATVSPTGAPLAAAMHFAADGLKVYLHTYTYTRKYAAVLADPRVSYTLSYLPPDGFAGRLLTRGVQVSGTATVVTGQDEIEHAIELSHQQFDWLKETSIYDNFRRAGVAHRQVFIRVDPVEALWTDNRVRMLWRKIVKFTADGTHVASLEPYENAAA
ncbi:pyridoxamine 5'-phosphate oxidase family protein [Nonomuraea typhae]|uniref:pyridoxamine 5'-phosphate oxidase family protein n=1 Tax=Nonomuraea typhae TaxID=2603600 RepID=UPI0012F8807B|nr:pyridoxamine 5'-phosphate oxidase family protein [Nonomuraea typhae]